MMQATIKEDTYCNSFCGILDQLNNYIFNCITVAFYRKLDLV